MPEMIRVLDIFASFMAITEDPRLEGGHARELLALILGQKWGVGYQEVMEASAFASAHGHRQEFVAVGRIPADWPEWRVERTADLSSIGLGARVSEHLVVLTATATAAAEAFDEMLQLEAN